VEALALLAMHERPREGRSLFATLLLPHHGTHGRARMAELALGVLGWPVVAAGAPMLLISGRAMRRLAGKSVGELAAVGAVALLGAPLVVSLLGWLGLWFGWSLTLVLGSLAALVIRATIRMRVDGRHSRALSELDRVDALPPATVPGAALATLPPPRAARLAPLTGAAPVTGPRPDDAPLTVDGPRLLR